MKDFGLNASQLIYMLSKISEKTMEYIELANKNISRDKKEIFYEVLGALSENIENLTEEKL